MLPTRDLELLCCFLFLGFLDLYADFLTDFFDVLEAFARPCACGLVSALELFIFGLEYFDLIEKLLQTHEMTPLGDGVR
jgi:hypothetical protein